MLTSTVVVGSAGAPYGTTLASEVRSFCEALAARFDLEVELLDRSRTTVDAFFDAGGL